MNTFYSNGRRLPYTNSSGSTITSGSIVEIVDSQTVGFVGIAVADIANGSTGEVAISGVHLLTKSAGSITQGAQVYANAGSITATASSNCLAGRAYVAATSSATSVYVLLNGLPE